MGAAARDLNIRTLQRHRQDPRTALPFWPSPPRGVCRFTPSADFGPLGHKGFGAPRLPIRRYSDAPRGAGVGQETTATSPAAHRHNDTSGPPLLGRRGGCGRLRTQTGQSATPKSPSRKCHRQPQTRLRIATTTRTRTGPHQRPAIQPHAPPHLLPNLGGTPPPGAGRAKKRQPQTRLHIATTTLPALPSSGGGVAADACGRRRGGAPRRSPRAESVTDSRKPGCASPRRHAPARGPINVQPSSLTPRPTSSQTSEVPCPPGRGGPRSDSHKPGCTSPQRHFRPSPPREEGWLRTLADADGAERHAEVPEQKVSPTAANPAAHRHDDTHPHGAPSTSSHPASRPAPPPPKPRRYPAPRGGEGQETTATNPAAHRHNDTSGARRGGALRTQTDAGGSRKNPDEAACRASTTPERGRR